MFINILILPYNSSPVTSVSFVCSPQCWKQTLNPYAPPFHKEAGTNGTKRTNKDWKSPVSRLLTVTEGRIDRYCRNPDIDTSRSRYNFHIVKPEGRYSHFIQNPIEQAGRRRKSRRAASPCCPKNTRWNRGSLRKQSRPYRNVCRNPNRKAVTLNNGLPAEPGCLNHIILLLIFFPHSLWQQWPLRFRHSQE